MLRTDVAIIGAGAAGLYLAAQLPLGVDVTVIDKGRPGSDSGSSPWAQAGLAAAIGPDDSPGMHAEDTRAAGDGLCDATATEVLAAEAPGHIDQLIAYGARFDRHGPDGPLDLAREGGQRVARSVRRADATGAELIRVLREQLTGRVERLAGAACALARDDEGRVHGVWVLADDGPVGVAARTVVVATGGVGGLYAATTNPSSATGDGLALAAAAGAAARDLEFVQFHPTGLAVGDQRRFLLTEALRGAGATLHDEAGHRFMPSVHPDAELAPRHVVARAILEVAGGVAWIDATALGRDQLDREFPTATQGARAHGFDLAIERVPVAPAAHYHVGGVRTDLHGRTSLRGLYAVGEAASTGVHGANRLAGNSLSEALVFAARAARAIERDRFEAPDELAASPQFGDDTHEHDELMERLRIRMTADAGARRDARRLRELAADIETWQRELGRPAALPQAAAPRLALRAAAMIVRGAQVRAESRGGHTRTDVPERDPAWDGVHVEQISPQTDPFG